MTSNQLTYAKNQEEARSNRVKEAIEKRKDDTTRRGQNLKFASDMTGNVLNFAKGSKDRNDPKWYGLDPQLVKDAASISFNVPLGAPVRTELDVLETYPGLMTIEFVPTIGAATNESSVANIAAKNIYAFVRHANSGRSNYEAADLFMYLLAVDQAVSFWAHLRRIYSLALSCKSENRYYQDAILHACGVDPKDIRSHIADLRTKINSFAVRLNAFFIPKDLPFITRHAWMNSTIWKDSPIKKSQDYLFVQRVFGHFGELPATNISLKKDEANNQFLYFPGRNLFYSQLAAEAESIINALMTSEDFGIMSGDILKAYGENGVYKIESTDEQYHIESIYEPEVLSQITNTIILGSNEGYKYDINQDASNGLIFQGMPLYDLASHKQVGVGIPMQIPGGLLSGRVGLQAYVLNYYKDDVSPDEVMVATRLTPTFSDKSYGLDSTTTSGNYVVSNCGTEVAVRCTIITLQYASNGSTSYKYQGIEYLNLLTGTIAGMRDTLNNLNSVNKFDWAPACIWFEDSTLDNAARISNRDVANYATVYRESFNNMHYVAVMSEFGVPLLANKVRSR